MLERLRQEEGSVDGSEVAWQPPDLASYPAAPGNTVAEAERWAADIAGTAYAIDDQTAIKVTDGTVAVVSEGHWKLFTPQPIASESG